jgi:hypothetical protein
MYKAMYVHTHTHTHTHIYAFKLVNACTNIDLNMYKYVYKGLSNRFLSFYRTFKTHI